MLNLFTNQSNWKKHLGRYDSNDQLDEEQVEQMTTNLLAASNLTDECYLTILDINQANIERWYALSIEEQLSNALENEQDKPIILQLCNGSHWITMGLLPNPNNPAQYYVVKMDGKSPDQEVVLSEAQIEAEAKNLGITAEYFRQILDTGQHQLDPQPVMDALKSLQNNLKNNNLNVNFITADDGNAFDLSVKGQQYNNSCGLDTALNSVSIIKTYIDLKKNDLKKNNSFNTIFNCDNFAAAFKQANDKNVFYQKKEDGKYYILGKATDLEAGEVVRILGTAVIEGKCIKENIEDVLNAQLIKKILLQDAIEDAQKNVNVKGKLSEALQIKLKELEDGTLTDNAFEEALNHTGFLQEIASKENIINVEAIEKQDKVNWSERIKDLGKRHNMHNIDIQH